MTEDRRKEIVRHLSEDDLDRLFAEIDEKISKRLTVGSPDLNPIEPIWKSLRWEASPLIVESAEDSS